MLDTLRLVETPEGVALQLHPAGVMPRAAAWAIDLLIRLTATALLLVLFGLFGSGAGAGLSLLLLFAMYWLYPILFEVLREGQTIGKRAIGLRVIHANGTPVGWLASIVRNLMRTVDMLPVLYGCGAVAGLLDPQGRRLGDMVAGTLVVHAAPAASAAVLPPTPAVWSEHVLLAEEKAALIAFAERGPRLTPERQAELADLLLPLTRQRGAPAVQRLYGMASALLGRQ
jgi:uncharacterized RDD family membrane protein YckC